VCEVHDVLIGGRLVMMRAEWEMGGYTNWSQGRAKKNRITEGMTRGEHTGCYGCHSMDAHWVEESMQAH
jgi:hypothetical protein